MDKRILEAVITKFSGGPVGLGSSAVAVGEEPDTLEEVYEPYLIMEGYLKRTPQGRVGTELSYKKLGLKASGGSQPGLLSVPAASLLSSVGAESPGPSAFASGPARSS